MESKEKRFECDHCQRLFARKEHLLRHFRTHTLEKPFQCEKCETRFSRSDLLVRHDRLTHLKQEEKLKGQDEAHDEPDQPAPKRRRRTTYNLEEPEESNASPLDTSVFDQQHETVQTTNSDAPVYRDTMFPPHIGRDRGHDFLATLSFAAEQAALQDSLASQASNIQSTLTTPNTPFGYQGSDAGPYSFGSAMHLPIYPAPTPAPPAQMSTEIRQPQNAALTEYLPDLDFEGSLDSLAAFLDNGALSSYHFSSVISAEQPIPLFSISPESLNLSNDSLPDTESRPQVPSRNQHQERLEEQSSFSRFGSRLPSLQPEERPMQNKASKRGRRPLADVSLSDRQFLIDKLTCFPSTVSADFKLPSRLALSRYLAAYVSGFHEHLPFLHISTMTVESCYIELVLAMAAVGAQYCFEGDRGVDLFHASLAIASQRIRRKDARMAASHYDYRSSSVGSRSSISHVGPLGVTSYAGTPNDASVDKEDLMQTAQALLVLMAMATWAKNKDILREALAIQSTLAALVREDGLRAYQLEANASWEEWVHLESVKRTKFIVFCFFNLHCIVYNIPPLILNSEMRMVLPSSAREFKAASKMEWQEANKKAVKPIMFQDALGRLFVKGGKDITEWNSSLGNYVLIHAIIQHIFFARQTAKSRYSDGGDLTVDDISALELALRNWQIGWRRNPESSLDPMDPNGPVAFNSTALLRLAYIRLNIDTGPGRALDTRDPYQIANAFREAPAIKRTPKLVRAVLHSAHALSIPVKIGIRLVAQTQTFIWSIQHSLCSLECAFLLSKWFETLSLPNPEPAVTDDEKRIVALVRTMLDETEFAVSSEIGPDTPAYYKHLSAGVLRVWATIFCGGQTWAIVDVIGTSLNIYADMLESDFSVP